MTVKRGVSLYSFQEEYFLRTMTLEDCIARIDAISCGDRSRHSTMSVCPSSSSSDVSSSSPSV